VDNRAFLTKAILKLMDVHAVPRAGDALSDQQFTADSFNMIAAALSQRPRDPNPACNWPDGQHPEVVCRPEIGPAV